MCLLRLVLSGFRENGYFLIERIDVVINFRVSGRIQSYGPKDEKYCITYYSPVKSRCEIHKIPHHLAYNYFCR
jgi:hypothetical protein